MASVGEARWITIPILILGHILPARSLGTANMLLQIHQRLQPQGVLGREMMARSRE